MTEKPFPIVTDFETALNLSIEKWEGIKADLNNVYGKWDTFCGFCHYAVYLRDKAGPKGDHDKCTYCDKRIKKICKNLLYFKGKYTLYKKINKILKALNEMKKELKTDA